MEGTVTEQGTLTNLRVLNSTPNCRSFESSARGAVAFWRFTPPMIKGCPAAALLTVTVRYKLGR